MFRTLADFDLAFVAAYTAALGPHRLCDHLRHSYSRELTVKVKAKLATLTCDLPAMARSDEFAPLTPAGPGVLPGSVHRRVRNRYRVLRGESDARTPAARVGRVSRTRIRDLSRRGPGGTHDGRDGTKSVCVSATTTGPVRLSRKLPRGPMGPDGAVGSRVRSTGSRVTRYGHV